jgi:hypothetical protein
MVKEMVTNVHQSARIPPYDSTMVQYIDDDDEDGGGYVEQVDGEGDGMQLLLQSFIISTSCCSTQMISMRNI